MKKVICAILLFAVCFAFASCGGSSEIEIPDGMKLASEESDLFNFFIPSAWTSERGYDMPYAYYSATDTSNVSVMLYLLNGDNAESEGATENAEEELTTQLSDTAATENPRAPYINQYWKEFLDEANKTLIAFELVEQTETKLSGYYAHSYVYVHKISDVTYKHRSVVTYYGDMIVCFTYSSTSENYDSHAADVDKMLTEFEFKK